MLNYSVSFVFRLKHTSYIKILGSPLNKGVVSNVCLSKTYINIHTFMNVCLCGWQAAHS